MFVILINKGCRGNFYPIDIRQTIRAQTNTFTVVQSKISQCAAELDEMQLDAMRLNAWDLDAI